MIIKALSKKLEFGGLKILGLKRGILNITRYWKI